ncbi:hypothetical protein DL89DRAFT_19788 [Linderina pennispora]|uniref:Uncharacterized protein n=1 Tax=Linderina pennispora TaxID=61395 RepID=A0A1Y1WM23_9FUNG|nr:uncharacterized protein DL89DRAFT_19788 [Linderina pennispora]ORX74607.1 hypothetical protein DL89DRAFT_19788 [Linderina pennispora]
MCKACSSASAPLSCFLISSDRRSNSSTMSSLYIDRTAPYHMTMRLSDDIASSERRNRPRQGQGCIPLLSSIGRRQPLVANLRQAAAPRTPWASVQQSDSVHRQGPRSQSSAATASKASSSIWPAMGRSISPGWHAHNMANDIDQLHDVARPSGDSCWDGEDHE